MINQDKKIKAFFSTDELDMLYSLGISKNDTVAKAKEILDSCTKLALDLEDLEYISSAGLRVLLRLAKKAQKENKKFCLVNINGLVKEILEESGLDVLFTILSNEKQLI